MQLLRSPRGAPLRVCRLVAALTALAFALAGCSYQSTYVPPPDGRARVIWKSNDAVGMEVAGAGPTELCQQEITGVRDRAAEARRAGRAYEYGPSSGVAWVPRYYGPPIIVVQPGLPPPFLRPPLFLPRLGRPLPPGHVSISGNIGVRGSGGGGSGGGHGGGGHGGGGSSGGDLGALVVVILVIAVSVLPALALGYAASMPESAGTSSSVTDFVNAYNDLSRLPGTPCTPIWTPAMEAPPP
jgi:hypothetical protein